MQKNSKVLADYGIVRKMAIVVAFCGAMVCTLGVVSSAQGGVLVTNTDCGSLAYQGRCTGPNVAASNTYYTRFTVPNGSGINKCAFTTINLRGLGGYACGYGTYTRSACVTGPNARAQGQSLNPNTHRFTLQLYRAVAGDC